MKKKIKLLLGLFLMTTLLLGCSKNNNDIPNQKNFMKIGETEYELSFGSMVNNGKPSLDGYSNIDGYNIDLTLSSNNFKITTGSSGFPLPTFDSGQIIYFEMFSSKGYEFDNGDYYFKPSEPIPIGTFNHAECTVNYGSNIWIEITSGKVTISKSGDEYIITINCIGDNEENITGFYKGSLQYFDFNN